MRTATVKVSGTAPYSQSRPILAEKKPKEGPKEYEERTWRERIHADKDGAVYMPPTAWKNGIAEAAKYLSLPHPNGGRAKLTKHFVSGVLVADRVYLGVKKEDMDGEWLFVPSDGRRGGGKRVWKCFPYVPEWEAEVVVHLLDDVITKDAFRQVIEEMGKFIGVGRFRPANNGFYGRFSVEEIRWS